MRDIIIPCLQCGCLISLRVGEQLANLFKAFTFDSRKDERSTSDVYEEFHCHTLGLLTGFSAPLIKKIMDTSHSSGSRAAATPTPIECNDAWLCLESPHSTQSPIGNIHSKDIRAFCCRDHLVSYIDSHALPPAKLNFKVGSYRIEPDVFQIPGEKILSKFIRWIGATGSEIQQEPFYRFNPIVDMLLPISGDDQEYLSRLQFVLSSVPTFEEDEFPYGSLHIDYLRRRALKDFAEWTPVSIRRPNSPLVMMERGRKNIIPSLSDLAVAAEEDNARSAADIQRFQASMASLHDGTETELTSAPSLGGLLRFERQLNEKAEQLGVLERNLREEYSRRTQRFTEELEAVRRLEWDKAASQIQLSQSEANMKAMQQFGSAFSQTSLENVNFRRDLRALTAELDQLQRGNGMAASARYGTERLGVRHGADRQVGGICGRLRAALGRLVSSGPSDPAAAPLLPNGSHPRTPPRRVTSRSAPTTPERGPAVREASAPIVRKTWSQTLYPWLWVLLLIETAWIIISAILGGRIFGGLHTEYVDVLVPVDNSTDPFMNDVLVAPGLPAVPFPRLCDASLALNFLESSVRINPNMTYFGDLAQALFNTVAQTDVTAYAKDLREFMVCGLFSNTLMLAQFTRGDWNRLPLANLIQHLRRQLTKAVGRQRRSIEERTTAIRAAIVARQQGKAPKTPPKYNNIPRNKRR